MADEHVGGRVELSTARYFQPAKEPAVADDERPAIDAETVTGAFGRTLFGIALYVPLVVCSVVALASAYLVLGLGPWTDSETATMRLTVAAVFAGSTVIALVVRLTQKWLFAPRARGLDGLKPVRPMPLAGPVLAADPARPWRR